MSLKQGNQEADTPRVRKKKSISFTGTEPFSVPTWRLCLPRPVLRKEVVIGETHTLEKLSKAKVGN